MGVEIKFNAESPATDPQEMPVVVLGQLRNLQKVSFDQVRSKLEPRVDAETWKTAVSMLQPSPTDTLPLHFNVATVAALPVKCSRHNTPSRCHAVTKMVKSCSSGQNETFVVRSNI